MHRTISQILLRHLSGEQTVSEDVLDELEPDEQETTYHDGIAVIPVRGVISKDISRMERISGAVDVREIGQRLESALADPMVEGIVLAIDSPGGTVQGVPELAARIAEINTIKPVIAYTDGLMASAAYWLASGSEAIIAARSSTIGSIGVYLAFLDESRALELAGYKMELIKSSESPLKAAGLPGTSLSEAQRADFQRSVDYLYDLFAQFVRENRSRVDGEAMRGQTMFGDQAVGAGLIDEVGDISVAITSARMTKKNKN